MLFEMFRKKYKESETVVVVNGGNQINLVFYKMENGRIPVQDFLYSLEPKLRGKVI